MEDNFDPDKYLAETPDISNQTTEFDPDKYLADTPDITPSKQTLAVREKCTQPTWKLTSVMCAFQVRAMWK
jgi:hypothetical protein